MTRAFAIAVVLAALAVPAAGCGDDEETTTAAPPAETTTEPETTTEGEAGEKEDESTIERPKPGQSAPEALASEPEYVIDLFFTSGDPDLVCGELATENLLSSAYGDEMGCRQAQVPAAIPDSIEVEELDVSGNEAQATVIPDGGPNDGIETEVELVKEGNSWLVDLLEADIPAGP